MILKSSFTRLPKNFYATLFTRSSDLPALRASVLRNDSIHNFPFRSELFSFCFGVCVCGAKKRTHVETPYSGRGIRDGKYGERCCDMQSIRAEYHDLPPSFLFVRKP